MFGVYLPCSIETEIVYYIFHKFKMTFYEQKVLSLNFIFTFLLLYIVVSTNKFLKYIFEESLFCVFGSALTVTIDPKIL